MHNHIHAVSPNLVNLYSARALEKTDAAQRAADVRKKLVNTEVEVQVEGDADDGWLSERGYQSASQQGRPQTNRAKKESQGEEQGDFVESLSVWA